MIRRTIRSRVVGAPRKNVAPWRTLWLVVLFVCRYLTKPYDDDELKARLRAGERILDLEDRLVEARENMRFQATHDPMTALWSRGVIEELLSREIDQSRRENSCTVVMLCDVDHFTRVNDQFGHNTRDDVLRELAQRLQRSVRSYDMVGRYGAGHPESVRSRQRGDARGKSARRHCQEAVPHAFANALRYHQRGVALSTDFQSQSLDELLAEVDAALYRAKGAGRNCIRRALPALQTASSDIR